MSVRRKIRLVAVIALLGAVAVAWVLLHSIVARGCARLDAIETREQVRRATAALSSQVEALTATTRDWASWDESCRLFQGREGTHLGSDLAQEALSRARVDLVCYVDREGRIIGAATGEKLGAVEGSVRRELERRLSPKGVLLERCLQGEGSSGVMLLPRQVWLIAGQPIAGISGGSPARGMVVMARNLSSSELTAIAHKAMVPFTACRFDEPCLPAGFREARELLQHNRGILVGAASSATVSGYVVVEDLQGLPALILRTEEDRHIKSEGQVIILGSVVALLLGGVLMGVAVNLVLERGVISRLSGLSGSVRSITERGEASARVAIPGSDELSSLANDINGMLSALEQSRNAAQENQDHLRTILDSVHTGLLIIDADTHEIVDANLAALETIGCVRQEVIGSVCYRRVCPAGAGHCPITDLHQELDNAEQSVLTFAGESVPVIKTAALVTLAGKRYILESFLDITERKHAEEAIRYQAYHDGLTGLPNRTRFYERLDECLAQARRDDTTVAVLFLDLDRFKTINDTLGHAVGDGLLKQVARRLTDSLRGKDSVARLGGDEFAVLLTGLESPESAAVVSRRALQSLHAPFFINGYELHTTASIGISVFPRDGVEAENLLQSADIALYHAKDQGRNTFRYYDSWINESTRERLTLENDLRHALERHQLVVHYQPQIHVPTGRIVGMEALLRWRHAELGLLLPGQFIAIAEESGLIEPIGEWVLDQTCKQNKAWQLENLPPVKVAVNLSPIQFHQQNLIAVVRRALGESGLDPRYLQLELTESTAMRNVDFSTRLMARLKDMGVGLCLDDFGIGYTSLAYLKQFPLDVVKIDRAFLHSLDADGSDSAIISAIIGIARSLGLGIIGEGVETPAQLRLLLERDCEIMQGYLFSKPLPGEAATALLREQRTERTAIHAA